MASPLQKLLQAAGLSHAHLARQAQVSKSVVWRIAKHGQWTQRSKTNAQIQTVIAQLLTDEDLPAEQIAKAMAWQPKKQKAQSRPEKHSEPSARATKPVALISKTIEGNPDMLLRKHPVREETRAHFGLAADPFVDDLRSASDVVNHKTFRLALTQMRSVAKHGGMMALLGESGAGKSTARRMLLDEFQSKSNFVIIEPKTLGMDENVQTGSIMKSAHIAEAIIARLDPTAKLRRSPEARNTQLEQMLKNSFLGGRKHVLLIEEAHRLHWSTIKQLKGFYELESGFTPMLAIILIGQTELRHKLKEGDSELREFVARCQVVDLAPLGESLKEYITFKLKRVGGDLDAVLEKGALEALVKRLTITTQRGTARQAFGAEAGISKVYPLAVHNLLAAAMNAADELGAPKVTAQIVEGAGL